MFVSTYLIINILQNNCCCQVINLIDEVSRSCSHDHGLVHIQRVNRVVHEMSELARFGVTSPWY